MKCRPGSQRQGGTGTTGLHHAAHLQQGRGSRLPDLPVGAHGNLHPAQRPDKRLHQRRAGVRLRLPQPRQLRLRQAVERHARLLAAIQVRPLGQSNHRREQLERAGAASMQANGSSTRYSECAARLRSHWLVRFDYALQGPRRFAITLSLLNIHRACLSLIGISRRILSTPPKG